MTRKIFIVMNVSVPHNLRIFSFFIVLLLSSSACRKETMVSKLPTNNLMLGNLSIGQTSQFQRFTYNLYDTPSPARVFTEDTLVVEVLAAQQGGMLVREYLTTGSKIARDEPEKYQDTIELIWYIFEDSLSIGEINETQKWPTSYLLQNFYKPIDISLYATGDTGLIGWYPTQPSGAEVQEYLAPFNIHIDYSAMILDGPGKFYIFEPFEKIIRTAVHSPWTGEGEGWELLQ